MINEWIKWLGIILIYQYIVVGGLVVNELTLLLPLVIYWIWWILGDILKEWRARREIAKIHSMLEDAGLDPAAIKITRDGEDVSDGK